MSARRFCGFPARATVRALIGRSPFRRCIEGLSATLALLLAQPSCALADPLTISASVDSQDVIRGVSYSLGRPAYGLHLSYDLPNGVYASTSLSGTASFQAMHVMRGAVENVGYAGRVAPELSVDVGVSHADYLLNTNEKYIFSYDEAYGGATYRNVSAYLYYTPHYMGAGPEALYLDLHSAMRAAPHVRLAGHLGFLAPLRKWRADADKRKDIDLSASAIYEFPQAEVRLTWATSSHYFYDPPVGRQQSDSVMAGATWFF
jgi:uncharacterized protein (TIGR02001 family)